MPAEQPASFTHFGDWLGASPCRFARLFASRGSIRPLEFLKPFAPGDVRTLDRTLAEAAEAHDVVLALWPLLRTAEEVVDVLLMLRSSPRWRYTSVPWGQHTRPDATLVGLTWETLNGDLSSAMGFAPLGSMPVTRRAPYVALAVWPGGHESANPKYSSPEGHVGFIDCKMPKMPDGSDYDYDKFLKPTLVATGALLAAPPPDDRKVLRDVAFCLPTSSLGDLLARASDAAAAAS